MTDEVYIAKIKAVASLLATDPVEAREKYPSARMLAKETLPDQAVNNLLPPLIPVAKLGYSVTDFKQEQKAWFRKLEKEAEAQEKADALRSEREAILGLDPANEREYMAAFMGARDYRMNFHREFTKGDDRTPIRAEDIASDARLTAADLDLIKPRGHLLGASEISVALGEWASQRRREAQQTAIELVAELPEGINKADVDAGFKQVCEWYFREPAFAEAAIRKIIWSVKRKMRRMPIKNIHMVIIVGSQGTGKTEFMRMLMAVLDELSHEATLQEILDTRQSDLPEYYLLFTDELAFADKIEPGLLKTFITGASPSRRPMRTNISERVHINATLIGTANHSLDKMIYDSSGTRRFVEIKPRTREEIEPNWDGIVAYNKLHLWQSINPEDDDPLTPFAAELLQKQETIRNLDNAEQWLQDFDHLSHIASRRPTTSSIEASEFYATDLFDIFRNWEVQFCPGFRGTSLARWGRDVKSLIENGRAPMWTWKLVQHRTVYRMEHPPLQQETGMVIPLGMRTKTR